MLACHAIPGRAKVLFGKARQTVFSCCCKKLVDNSIWCSQAVSHPSTDQAQRCLTSVIGRELVFSTRYGRCWGRKARGSQPTWPAHCIFQQSIILFCTRKHMPKKPRVSYTLSTSWVQHNSQIFRKLSWSPHLHSQMNKGKELYANI